MDVDEPLLLNVSEKKFRASCGRKMGVQARFVCTGASRVSRGHPPLRIFNQRKFEYEIRAVFARRFLSVRMKTVTTRRLENPRTRPVYRKADRVVAIELYRVSVTIREKRREITASRLDANFFKPRGRYVSFVLRVVLRGARRVSDGEPGERG